MVLGRVGLEKAAKENAQGVEPIVIEEESSPPHAIPADVGEASTPPDATGDTPLHLRRPSPPTLLGLLIHHLLDVFLVLYLRESARLRLVELALAWYMVLPYAFENSSMLGILLAFAWSSRSWHAWLRVSP